MKRWIGSLLGLMLTLTACSASETHLPYEAWRIGFGGPPHMEVWVEDAQVLDVTGKHLRGYGVGIASVGHKGIAYGWPKNPGPSKGMDVVGAALPKEIYVRWQSLVEPQTYQVVLHFTDAMRKQMLTMGPPRPTAINVTPRERYYKNVIIDVAPGGWVKVWLSGVVVDAAPIMCVRAQIDSVGPYSGKSNGKYRPLTKQAADYIADHPIPYDSWKCDKP